MKYLGKLFLMLVVISVILVACAQQQQIYFIDIPQQLTSGEAFNIKGEYLTKEPNVKQEVKINLRIIEVNQRQIYSEEIILSDYSQDFTFSEIALELKEDIFFQLRLIIDGRFISKIDTSSNLTSIANWHTNIYTTYFEASGTTTWGYPLAEENPYFCALPYRDFYYLVGTNKEDAELKRKDYYGITDVKNRWLEIYYPPKDRYVYTQWVDVGPWNYYDPHYVFSNNDHRPYAEIGIDMGWQGFYRETNLAGLDISPKAMEYLTEDYKQKGIILVNWRFIEVEDVPDGPWLERVSKSKAVPEILNLETETLRNSNF